MRTASRARVEISRSLPSVPLRVRGRNERENGGIRMDQMEGESARTPTFMSSLAQRLRDEDGVDAALTAILEEHILVDNAAPDAIAKAKAAIMALATARATPAEPVRSEEHTYELQSLMRTSYAVFSLK